MNRIYRRIWNATRQCWVVASELAAARGKFSRAPQAALLMAVSISGSALANPLATDDTHEEDAVVIAPFEWYRASMGNELMFPAPLISQAGGAQLASSPSPRRMYALVTDTLAADSNISGDHMLVVGTRSSLIGNKSVGYGNLISSKGDHNTAVGFQVETQGGYATSVGATSRALEIGASAFGNNALAARVNTVALGSGARAQANNAVALGANSYANEVNTVSVGTSSEKRRIVNVEEGRLNALSTDAVTGGQLFQTNARVGSVESKARGFESHLARIDAKMSGTTVELGDSASASGEGSIAIGSRAASSGLYSMAAGINSRATSLNAVALGASSYATEMNALALGASTRATARDSIAIGFQAVAGHQGSVAIGRQSATSGNDQVSVGNATLKRKIVNVADGTVAAGSSDAVTGAQLHSVDVQVKAASNRIDATNLALGKGAVAESGSYGISTAIGNNAKAYNGRSVALGFDALAGVDAEGNRVTGQNAGVSIGANTRSANGAVATGFRAIASGNFSIAVGGDANAAAEHATAMGYLSKATAKQSTALGRGSEAKAQFATALGNLAVSANTSAVALGDRANARHDNAVALGAGAVTASVNSVSVGSATLKRKIQYIADGAVSNGSTDAITGNQLFATNQAVSTAQSTATSAQTAANAAKADATKALAETAALTGLVSQTGATGNVRLGGKNSGTVLDVRNSANASRKVAGVADGTVGASSNEAVNGKQLNATNVQVAAVEKAAAAAQADATVAKADAAKALVSTTALEGLVSQTAANGNVRLGGKNSGTVLDVRNSANASRKLTGVADGLVNASSYEAVNGRQLNATNDKVAAVESIARAAGTEAAAAKTDAAKALVETAALGGLVAQVSTTGNVRLGERNSGTTLDVRNSANANRKISGVADGLLSTSSSEAVSGKQLHSSNSRISALEGVSQYLSIGVAPISEPAEAGAGGVAIGNSAKTGAESGTAVGTRARAMGRNSTAIGRGATVFEDSENGFAMGAGAEVGAAGGGANDGVAIGAGAKIGSGAHGSLALGRDAQANEAGVVSFGNSGMQRRLVNIARGTVDHNATTVSQLKDSLATLGGGAGMDASGNIIAPTYSVQAGTQNSVEDALMALDGAVISAGRRAGKVEDQLSSIFQDSPSARADGMNQIALNGANGMVLTNLADGRVAPGSRDAVTGNQLYAAEQKISQNRNDLEAMRKQREVGEQAMRGLDASGPIDFGGARLTGVADGDVSVGSRDAVNGAQLNETNASVIAAQSTADVARLESSRALVETSALSGLVGQVVETGAVRLGERNSGALIDVRNSGGANRRVTGVADASLGAGSNDAVTGSQLFSSNLRILAVERKSMFFDAGREDGMAPARAGQYSVALGNGALASVTAEGGTAIGAFSGAHAKNSVALGRAATVAENAEAGFALGAASYVAEKGGMALGTGSEVKAGAQLSVALGQGSVAGEKGIVSFGNSDLKRRLTNIANGTANHNAATVGQLRGALSALGGEVDANGNIVGPSFTVQGQSQSTLNGALEALDGAVVSNRSRVNQVESQLRSVFQDTPSVRADGLNQLTLAGTHGMVISNVANGLVAAGSRDAVNGGQLHSMQQQLNGRIDGLEERIDAPQPRAMAVASAPEPEAPVPQAEGGQQVASVGEGEKPAPQPKSKQDDTPKPQVDTAELEKMLARANEYTDGAISNFERRLDKMDKRFNRMAAMSSAQTAMAMNTAGLATYNRLGAGVGYSEGESAMAVGYQRVLNEKGSATFSLNGAFTNSGERSMGVGVGIGW
ncbi:ESPR-type extended signal peptide-containing protein [Stenotrophomonas maltophilia]|uniref:ESPR-type extended signal peptide-containing protein n=1 Tax=Stenotrophomonas maltophilia TaxID=40324 RepID=UPI0013D8FBF2|nr:ESPR-type extended signal peptide-containing protein [Stenotrophomonas maltophilia]